MPLLVVGSVAYDGLETPRGKVDRMLGGAGTYIALAASHFVKVRLVAVVGDDFASEDEAILHRRNIDLEGLEKAPGKTFFWKGKYSPDMNRRETLTTDLNVFADFKPKLPETYLDSSYILLGNIHPELQSLVLDQAYGTPIVGGDTMNYWIERTPEALAQTIRRWQIIMINDEEARQISGQNNLRKAAREIHAMGPQTVVIKQGEHGAAMFHNNNCFIVPGYPLKDLFDPTGAGDAFAGGFLGYLANQNDAGTDEAILRKAMVYGSVMGSFCCEQFGVDQLNVLKDDQIKERYGEFRQLTSY